MILTFVYLLFLVTERKASQTCVQSLEKNIVHGRPHAVRYWNVASRHGVRDSACVLCSKAVETIQPQDGGRLFEGG